GSLIELTIQMKAYQPTPTQPTGKIAYLTVDDDPSALTEQVLDILKENDVKATFFLVGENVASYPKVVERMFDEGHGIGGHTYSHDYIKSYRTPDTLFAALAKGTKAIADVTGVTPKIFRFPGGSNNLVSKDVQDL